MFDIRDNLKQMIVNKGLKQSVVAAKSGLTSEQLSNILNRKRQLEAGELFAICDTIGTTPERLLRYSSRYGRDG